jgi:hypothetical protein
VIDASAAPEAVADAVWAVVNARLHPAEAPLVIEGVTS